MKKIFLLLSAAAVATALSAQDIYKAESLTGTDLNGTARYVGMGGAMNALGADLTTIGSNPAGIGVYRRSDIAATLSVTGQPDADKFNGVGRTRFSFDQLGVVYSMPVADKIGRAHV